MKCNALVFILNAVLFHAIRTTFSDQSAFHSYFERISSNDERRQQNRALPGWFKSRNRLTVKTFIVHCLSSNDPFIDSLTCNSLFFFLWNSYPLGHFLMLVVIVDFPYHSDWRYNSFFFISWYGLARELPYIYSAHRWSWAVRGPERICSATAPRATAALMGWCSRR